jgi:hypothetical protein
MVMNIHNTITARLQLITQTVAVDRYEEELDPAIVYYRLTRSVHVIDQMMEPICYEASWPCDWWQAFKERWFPAFLLKRYPVKYTHLRKSQVPAIVNLPILPNLKTVMLPIWHKENNYEISR